MYKVFCDDTLICDSRVEELVLINPDIELEENKAGSFSFTMSPKHPYYNLIKRRKSIPLSVFPTALFSFCDIFAVAVYT